MPAPYGAGGLAQVTPRGKKIEKKTFNIVENNALTCGFVVDYL